MTAISKTTMLNHGQKEGNKGNLRESFTRGHSLFLKYFIMNLSVFATENNFVTLVAFLDSVDYLSRNAIKFSQRINNFSR